MSIKKVEILAPAGSFTGLQASFKAGADAVYMGGTRFGARAYADNPDDTGLLRAIDYAHLRNKKLYLTVNTMIKENELEAVYAYLLPLYKEGLDAVIVQDLGVLKLVNDCFPGLDIHLSTQMSITDKSPLSYLPKAVTRIVPARELTLPQIKTLKEKSGLELEVFIHGALCYSYSGHCLFSSMCGDRSGNRGRCAQPCRKQYEYRGKKAYILSPRDICTLESFPGLIEAGVDSFKIEGRMKAPEYAAGVTEVYRREIDRFYDLGEERYAEYLKKNADGTKNEKTVLMDLFNRGAFSSGYAFSPPGPLMMAGNRPNHNGVYAGKARLDKENAELKAETDLFKGDVLEIRSALSDEWYSYTCGRDFVKGSRVSFRALKSADRIKKFPKGKEQGQVFLDVYRMRCEKLLQRLNSDYVERDDRINVSGELRLFKGEKLSLRLTALNRGREFEVTVQGATADAAKTAALDEKSITDKVKRSGDSAFEINELKILTDGESFLPKAELGRIRRVAFEKLEEEILSLYARKEAPDGYKDLPIKGNTLHNGDDNKAKAAKLIIRCMDEEQKETAKEVLRKMYRTATGEAADYEITGYEVSVDSVRKYSASNHAAVMELFGAGVKNITIGHELDKREIAELLNGVRAGFKPEENKERPEMILDIYGRELVMISRQCIKKNFGTCRKKDKKEKQWDSFKNADGGVYPFFTDCRYCLNYIFDSEPTNLLSCRKETDVLGADAYRLSFTDETPAQVKKILGDFLSNSAAPGKKGHFLRGVQ